jgi:oligopeptide transport system permease protein
MPSNSFYITAFKRFAKNRLAVVGLIVLAIVTILTVFAPLFSTSDGWTMDISNRNLVPSTNYWFGTDPLGRDLWTQVWLGTRASLLIAFCAVLIMTIIGVSYGAIMAHYKGIVSAAMMRLIEVFAALPGFLVTMIIIVILGNSLFALVVALCIASWMGLARQTRALFLKMQSEEFYIAANMLGSSLPKMIVKHLIPNITSILLLDITAMIPSCIFAEAALGFLGIGLKSPDISLGVLISSGQSQAMQYPSQMLIPTLVLSAILLSFTLIGDGLRDAFDVKGGQNYAK